MKTAVINFIKKNWKNILIVTLCGAIVFLTYKSIRKDASSNIKVSDREYVDSASAYHIIYNDKTISQLKKENKELKRKCNENIYVAESNGTNLANYQKGEK